MNENATLDLYRQALGPAASKISGPSGRDPLEARELFRPLNREKVFRALEAGEKPLLVGCDDLLFRGVNIMATGRDHPKTLPGPSAERAFAVLQAGLRRLFEQAAREKVAALTLDGFGYDLSGLVLLPRLELSFRLTGPLSDPRPAAFRRDAEILGAEISFPPDTGGDPIDRIRAAGAFASGRVSYAILAELIGSPGLQSCAPRPPIRPLE